MTNRAEQQQTSQQTAEFMAMNQVFTLDELAEHLGGEKRLAKYRIRYHLSQNRLKRLANGVYATVPAGVEAETFEPDVFLAAAAIRPDAVFAYHSALDLLGQGHSVWWTCTVCTDRPRAPVALGRNTIKFLTRPPAVRKQDESVSAESEQVSGWTTQISRGGRALRVAVPERTLVDGFRRLGLVGGLDELVESMDGFATLRPQVLGDVLRAYDNKRLWAAVGWYLQRRLGGLFLDVSVLEGFKANRPSTRVYLVPGQRGGVMAREWNLVVPEHLQRPERGGDRGS